MLLKMMPLARSWSLNVVFTDTESMILGLLGHWVGIVGYGLIVYLWHMYMSPCGLLEREPVAEGPEPEVEQPLRFAFLLRDEAYHLLVEALVNNVCLHIGGEAEFVLLVGYLLDKLVLFFFCHLYVCVHDTW